jgi:long-chain acyl-CoA synthetase
MISTSRCFSAPPLPLKQSSFEKLTEPKYVRATDRLNARRSAISTIGGKTKPGTIGLPVLGTDAKIVDVDDPTIEITSGEPGALHKGPQVMKGTSTPLKPQKQPLKTVAFTGDIVTVDDRFFGGKPQGRIDSRGEKTHESWTRCFTHPSP